MIVRAALPDLLLITQPDHAALAARVMERWIALADAPRRSEILLAIAEHDNGWRKPDGAPIVGDEGRILDFVSAPDDVRRGVWPRGVRRLAATPYAAALVAHHAVHVFDRYRSDTGWRAFFDEMTAMRDAQLARTDQSLAELLADYAFVRIGDLVSLAFCTAWTDEQEYAGHRIRLDGERLRISPDPFAGREIELAVPARRLPAGPWASAEEARRAFDEAPRTTITGAATGR